MNIGIIGSGNIAEQFISGTRHIKGINICAISSRNPNSPHIQNLGKKYGIKKIYGSPEEMNDDAEINFIYVASPNSLHFEQSLKALKKGKNVICEKPFTTTAKETEILLKTAEEKGLMIFEAILNIHLPNFCYIKENLHKIGTLRMVLLNFSQYSSKYDAFIAGDTPNVFNPAFSGGSLQDINIYNVHFAVNLLGLPEKFQYFPNKHANGIDTSGIMMMQYDTFTASLSGSKDSSSENFVYIQGEKGYIKVNSGGNLCKEIEIHTIENSSPEIFCDFPVENYLYYEIKDFYHIFKNKNWEKYNELCRHSLSVMKLVEAARLEAGIVFPADKKNQ